MAEVRKRRIQIRVRKEEFRCAFEKANREGKTLSEYVRDLMIKDCKE